MLPTNNVLPRLKGVLKMSVRNTIKIITLAGAAAVLPGVASAANPTFGDWTATGGTISNTGVNCPSGFSCEVINSGDGFLQANVTETAHPTNVFVQTIITDSAATCDNDTTFCAFTDENFVKTDGSSGSNGISGRQTSNDVALNFSSSVNINTGWALTVATPPPSVVIHQGLSDNPDGTNNNGDEFTTTFDLQINLDNLGAQTGKSMDISQDVGLGAGTTDNQGFVVRERSGDLLAASGTTTLGTATPATVNWAQDLGTPADSDDVMVTWISQDVDIGGAGSSLFAFQSVENKSGTSTIDQLASDFSTTANDPTVAPFDWGNGSDVKATFGDAPGCPGLTDC